MFLVRTSPCLFGLIFAADPSVVLMEVSVFVAVLFLPLFFLVFLVYLCGSIGSFGKLMLAKFSDADAWRRERPCGNEGPDD